jgi:predicted nuclease with TOPRIM domain
MDDVKTSAGSTIRESSELDIHELATEQLSSAKQQIESSYSNLLREYNDLAEGYEKLKKHFDEETKFHQEQTSQNARVMADMQETINNLKLQLSDALAGRSISPGVGSGDD